MDTRPRLSPMPADAAAVSQALVDQLKPMFDRIAALPGDPAGRENDALSALADLGASAVQQLTGQLMLRKRVSFDAAFALAMHDIHLRAAAELLRAREGQIT